MPIMSSKILNFFLLIALASECSSFTSPRSSSAFTKPNSIHGSVSSPWSKAGNQQNVGLATYGSTDSRRFMADDEEGPGFLASAGIIVIMILLFGSGLLPMLDGGGRDLSIADSVVTSQDAPGKLQNFESTQDRLSRATIQEKLSAVPVFYISDKSGDMKTDIYMSYDEAQDAVSGIDGASVKATSLDQVMFPLVLQRGRMRMAPPPLEVENAEKELLSEGAGPKSYRLIPSKASITQAKEFKMDVAKGDVPLFVADRLAFAGPKGPQLPLFLDKSDCVYSYERLREAKKSLPEQPIIRTASLLDELISMEKGTRPGVSQLAFYATAGDLTQAADLTQ